MTPFALTMPGPFELLMLGACSTVPLAVIGLIVFLVVKSNKKK